MGDFYRKYSEIIDKKAFIPPLELRTFIVKYIIYENTSHNLGNNTLRALPNGMVELFILLDGSSILFRGKGAKTEYSSFLAGIFEFDYPMKINIIPSSTVFRGISITFTLKGVNRLLDAPIYEFTNRIIDLAHFGKEYRDQLIHKLDKSRDDLEQIDILNQFFLNQLNKKNCRDQQEIHEILEMLEKKTALAISSLKKRTILHEQTLYPDVMKQQE